MGTIIVGAIVLVAFLGIGYYMYKQKKAGKSSCSSCSGCSHRGTCSSEKKQ